MDRRFAQTLLSAWEHPEFRAALQHLIDLDEVGSLLAALATGTDQAAEQRSVELLRSALDTPEIRGAVMVLLDADDTRHQIGEALEAALQERPQLARTVRSAMDDPKVRVELAAALEQPAVRDLVCRMAEKHKRLRLVWNSVLLLRHRSVRRLVAGLHKHGVLRALTGKA